MSNLKLPILTFDAITESLKTAHPNATGDIGKSVAYATGVATLGYNPLVDPLPRTVAVIHHTSVIASLWVGAGNLHITNAGYSSSTTRTRLNKVLNDNKLTQWGVTQKNFVQVLINFDSKESFPDFQSARFENGKLVAFNEVGV